MKARVKELEDQVRIINRRLGATIETLDITRDSMDRAGIPHPQEAVYNTGDWTTFENIEIGDMIGGIKITTNTQLEILRAMSKALKAIEDIDHLERY